MQQVMSRLDNAERYVRSRALQLIVAGSGALIAAFIAAALLSPCFGGTWQAFSLILASSTAVLTVLRFGRSKMVVAITLLAVLAVAGIARPYVASAASGSCPVGDDEVFAGEIGIQGGTAFTTTVTAAPAADGTWTIPAAGQATDTFAGIAAAQTLTNKTLTAPTMSGIATGSWVARWSGGTAITAAQYEISRDADATNQLHFNVPTGAGYEWSVNDVAELTLTATTLDVQNNAITTTGAITGSTFNGNTISTGTGTLTLGAGKTLTASNTLTFTGTDASSVAFGTGGTVTYTANNLSVFAATTSAQLAGVISDEQGSGALVFATSPSLTTPTLGVASATSINKVAFTTPATGSTLTIADGKTLTASNTLTFTGTDGSSVAFGTGGTVAYQGGTLAQFAATTSAQLAGVISDETGSGALAFATSPTLVTPNIGAATGTSVALTGSSTFTTSTDGAYFALDAINNSSGTNASSIVRTTNNAGAHQTIQIAGSGFSGYGAWTAGSGLVYTDSAAGMAVMADNAAGTIRLAAGGSGADLTVNANGTVSIGTGYLTLTSAGDINLVTDVNSATDYTVWKMRRDGNDQGGLQIRNIGAGGRMEWFTGALFTVRTGAASHAGSTERFAIDTSTIYAALPIDLQNNTFNNVGCASGDFSSSSAGVCNIFNIAGTTTDSGSPQVHFTGVGSSTGIFSAKTQFVDLSTSGVNILNSVLNPTFRGATHMRLYSPEGDNCSFTVYAGLDAGVAHNIWATGGPCTINNVGSTYFQISNMGDGRTWQIGIDGGNGRAQIQLTSGTATGTSTLIMIGMTLE